jgi:hypothetical protein
MAERTLLKLEIIEIVEPTTPGPNGEERFLAPSFEFKMVYTNADVLVVDGLLAKLSAQGLSGSNFPMFITRPDRWPAVPIEEAARG